MSLTGALKRLALVWGVLLVALNYVAMVRVGMGALKVPDLVGIYDAERVRGFLGALSDPTRQAYLETYLPLDYLFIATTFVFLILLARWIAPAAVWIVALCALAYVAADLTENLSLRAMVLDRAMPTCKEGCEDAFARLIWATRLKFLSLGLGCGILAWNYWKGRKP